MESVYWLAVRVLFCYESPAVCHLRFMWVIKAAGASAAHGPKFQLILPTLVGRLVPLSCYLGFIWHYGLQTVHIL